MLYSWDSVKDALRLISIVGIPHTSLHARNAGITNPPAAWAFYVWLQPRARERLCSRRPKPRPML